MQRNNNYNGQKPEIKTVTQNDVNFALNEIKADYTIYAEKVIKQLFEQEAANPISTNQLRSIYELVAPLVESYDKQDEEILKNDLRKIKIKIAYQIGRDDIKSKLGTNDFNKATSVLELVNKVLSSTEFRKDLQLYLNYWEALVAYHKYYDLIKKLEKSKKIDKKENQK